MAEAVLIAAVAAGVILPKALPAMLAPSQVSAPVRRWLDALPATTLGALTAMAVLSASHGARLDPVALGAVCLAGVVVLTGHVRRVWLRRRA